MSDNKKAVIVSLAALAISGIALTILLITSPKETENHHDDSQADHAETISLINKDINDIKSVEIKNETGSYVIKLKEDAYYIESLGIDIKTDQSEFVKNLGYLALLPADELIEENGDLKVYGLEQPKASIVTRFNDNTEYTLNIGDSASVNSLTYISLNDQTKIYTIQSFKIAPLLLNEYSYIEKKLFPEHSGEEIKRLKIINSYGEPIVIEPNKNGAFIMTKPVNLMINYDKSEDYIYGLFGFRADEAAGLYTEASEYGFDNPVCEVIVNTEDEEYIILIGEKTVNGYYMIANTAPGIVYITGYDKLPWINVTPEELMLNLFLLPYIYDIREFVIEPGDDMTSVLEAASALGSNKIAITVKGDNSDEEFLFNGKTIEAFRAKELYQYMISAYAEGLYTEEPDGPFLVRFVYKYKDSSMPNDVVEFYGSDDRNLIIKLNGITSFKCREAYFERLIQNIDAFLNNEKIIMSW